MRELEGRIPDEIINLKGKDDADLIFCYPNQKLIPIWKLSTNITRLFGITTFLITDFAIFKPEINFFESGKE